MNSHKFMGHPHDDDGVKNEQVVEICEFVIQKSWEKMHKDNKEMSIEDMQKMMTLATSAWETATNVIEYNKHLEEEEFMRQMHMEQHEDDDENNVVG